ncbi:hypothetical protein [Haloterrigena salina]|uniref:hypothetical protein n=1 Tax=Haloterrigena salina TaxID=504937 RepID=UPI001268E32A|nr:hypothetical protein [Haloterrigena salina]
MLDKSDVYNPNHDLFDNGDKIYFDADDLEDPDNSYVAWVDLMGTRSWLLRSITHAANHIYKLHTAVASATYRLEIQDDLYVYTAMDGFYLVAEDKETIVRALEETFATMARTAIDRIFGTDKIFYLPIIRGSIAYGPIIHGSDIDDSTLDNTISHSNSTVDKSDIVLGDPISQAFDSESNAPPYGVYIDESARGFSSKGDDPFNRVWLDWYHHRFGENDYEEIAGLMRILLIEYFDWCDDNSGRIRYPDDRRKEHKKWAKQYLPEIELET